MSSTIALTFNNGMRNIAVVVDLDAPHIPHPIDNPEQKGIGERQYRGMVEHNGLTNIFQRFPPDPSSWNYWPGWYPTFKHGLEVPWSDGTWGKPPDPLPKGWSPRDGIPGEVGIMSKNEFYPLLIAIRDRVGRDFYKMDIYHIAANGEHIINLDGIGSMRYSHCDHYQLVGNFPGAY
jgi:hypothetical protein